MNIKDLNVFLCVAQERSLQKASKLLYMTPQGISKIIKNMEDECDCRLFDRTGSGMILTECGESFRKYADRILSDYRDMRTDILRIRQKESGIVDLLSAYGVLRLVTPECILDFRKKYPDIEFHYREGADKQIERWFAAQEGNVAISLAPCDEDLYDVLVLDSFPVKLLVNEKHPLSHRDSVTIEDLKGETLYIESDQFKIHDLIVNKCREAGFEPDIAFNTSGFSLCHKMVRDNKGISVTVDFISDDMHEKNDGLVRIPFSDGGYEWKIRLLTRKGDVPGNGVDLFINHIRERMDLIREGVITR